MDVKDGGRTIAKYLQDLDQGSITINRDYQRSRDIWPATAQSYFIESILLSFPIPKLALFPRTDVKARRTIEEIVDGQQRTDTLQRFVGNEVRIPKRTELAAAGQCYEEMDETLKERFLSYSIPPKNLRRPREFSRHVDIFIHKRCYRLWESPRHES